MISRLLKNHKSLLQKSPIQETIFSLVTAFKYTHNIGRYIWGGYG